MKGGTKHLLIGLISTALCLTLNTPVYGRSKKVSSKQSYVAYDTKRVIFPHRKHIKIINQLGSDCKTCHHRQKAGKSPRACSRCHARRQVSSKGEYARMGQRLNQKDIYHFLCWQCHKKMSQTGYKKPNGSSGDIPSKCHHCHVAKDNSRVSSMEF